MGYKILSQGVLDGACYMYSMMNAYKTLTYPKMDVMDFIYKKPYEKFGKQKWEYLINISPQTTDMLAGLGFMNYLAKIKTWDLEEVMKTHYNKLITEAFEILSDNDHQFSVKNISLESIKNFNFTHAVIILPIVKDVKFLAGNELGYHFICINGRTDDLLQVACSYSIYNIPQEQYVELMDGQTNRYYNNMINIKDLNPNTMEQGVDLIYQVTDIR
jgi:hypothetical protein